jgi:putative transcriptional regulator
MATMNINTLLKKYKLNQKDLAYSTGINENTISRYCNGTFKKIDKNHIDLICKYLKCTPNDIFKLDDTVDVTPAKVHYYDNESDVFAEGEIKAPSNAFKRRATWHYDNSKIPIPILQTDIEIPESVQEEYNNWMKAYNYQLKEDNNINIPVDEGSISQHQIITSRQVSKQAKQFREQNGYNPIPTEEEIIKMNEMQYKLDLEYTIENNLYYIIIWAINDANSDIYSDLFKEQITDYFNSSNLSFSFKLTTNYRILYNLLKSNHHFGMLGFLTRIRNIYADKGLLNLELNELESIKQQSDVFLNNIREKQNEYKQKD